jgi:hypothetical protein
MQDNAIFEILIPAINSAIIAMGYTGVIVKKANQPTQQGINTGPTVYIFKVSDHRYGFLSRTDAVDPDSTGMIHTEQQTYETTFQISALVIQNPKNISYTASDLVNVVASIMQSDSMRQILFNSQIQILRITEVANPYFLDDMDRYESGAFFRFTLTHQQTINSEISAVQSSQAGIFPI